MDQHIAVVTGGSSGIGEAVVRRLIQQGSTVVLVDRDTAAISTGAEADIDPVSMDVGDPAAWKQLAGYLSRKYGRVDGLVHNAGIAPVASLLGHSDETFDRVYATNVRSVLVGTRDLWDLLVVGRGSVVNVASVAALVGQDNSSAYVASKGAVVAATRALAIELAPHGVRVNSVCPGTTLTPMLKHHLAMIPDGAEVGEQMKRRMPVGRLLTPDDIAPTIVHLLSNEAAPGITGANIVVDGGLTATFDYGNAFAGGLRRDG